MNGAAKTLAIGARFRRAMIVAVSAVLLSTPSAGQQLAQFQYRLTGLSLIVSPSALTVPRGVATQLNTTLASVQSLPAGAVVHATLRGPSLPDALEIRATPNQPILLPPLTQPGLHFLENIRLDIDHTTSVRATPSVVTINVLDQLLVGTVTSRPLALDEIRRLGIQFDDTSFQAFMFTVAVTTESNVVNIDIPVLVPLKAGEEMKIGGEIPGLQVAQLPGLNLPNFELEPITLEPIVEPPHGVQVPAIRGIIVIPGSVAFLNQFFSVLMTVKNEAPDGTPLNVRNLMAEIKLPAGAD